MSDKAAAMRNKRERDRAAGLRDVTTPLPLEIIAEIDEEGNRRASNTRGDTIASVWQEWKQLKQKEEAATS